MAKPGPRRARATLPAEDVLVQIRIPLIQRAELVLAGRAEDVFMMDIGLRGVFVERSLPLPEGVTPVLRFRLPGNDIPVEARCRVAWWHAPEQALMSKSLPAGVGFEFLEVMGTGTARVRAFVEEYLKRGNRRFHRPPTARREDA